MDAFTLALYIAVACSLAALPLDQIVALCSFRSIPQWPQPQINLLFAAGAEADKPPPGGLEEAAPVQLRVNKNPPVYLSFSPLGDSRSAIPDCPPVSADVHAKLRQNATGAHRASTIIPRSTSEDLLRRDLSQVRQTPLLAHYASRDPILSQSCNSGAPHPQMPPLVREVASPFSISPEGNLLFTNQEAPLVSHDPLPPPLPPKKYARHRIQQAPSLSHAVSPPILPPKMHAPHMNQRPPVLSDDTSNKLLLSREYSPDLRVPQEPPLPVDPVVRLNASSEPFALRQQDSNIRFWLERPGGRAASNESLEFLDSSSPVTEWTYFGAKGKYLEPVYVTTIGREDCNSLFPHDKPGNTATADEGGRSTALPGRGAPPRTGNTPLQILRAKIGRLVRQFRTFVASDSASKHECNDKFIFDWLGRWVPLDPDDLEKAGDTAPDGGYVMVMHSDGVTHTQYRTRAEFERKSEIDRLMRTSVQDAVRMAEQLALKDLAQKSEILIGVWPETVVFPPTGNSR